MEVYDKLRFEVQNNEDMAAVRDKVMEMLPLIDSPQQAKQIMETLRIQRESILGKQPDTAIQVNNNVSTISDKDEFRQVALEVLQMVWYAINRQAKRSVSHTCQRWPVLFQPLYVFESQGLRMAAIAAS